MSNILETLSRSLCVLVLVTLATTAVAQEYRILVTNDDGIQSAELAALAAALAELPGVEVLVSAPAENQSGSSHASAGEELVVEEVRRAGQLFGYAVHGRPADAARWGIFVLGREQPIDLVVSGINQGANVGDVAHLSGTVGAAMEAQYQGIPSIAVSQDTTGVDTAASARFTANVVQRLRETGFPKGVVVSINIPRGDIQGVVVRQMGESYLSIANYEEAGREDGRSTYRRIRNIRQAEDTRTDTWAWQHGYITITPLKFDWTDYEYLSDLQSWDWEFAR